MGKSKGSSGVQESKVTQTNIPEYARPYFEELMGRTVFESTRPYEAYPGQRLAEFTNREIAGMQGFEDMARRGGPKQFTDASNIAAQVGTATPFMSGADVMRGYRPPMQYSEYRAGDIDSGYQAGDIRNMYQADQRGVNYMPGQRDVGYQAGMFDPGYEAGSREQGYQARDLVSDYMAGSFDPGYQAGARESQYTGEIDQGPGFQAGTIADPATLEKYMNPYTQLVTDMRKQEAQKQADIAQSQIEQQAAQSGGLGGYREAILSAELGADTRKQLDEIQATGDQAAFQQAQEAFERDRAARLSEGKFGLEAAGQRQQALQQREQFAQNAFNAGESARQEAAKLGLNAAQQEEAAKQAQEKFKQDAFAQSESGKALMEKLNQSAFQAGERAKQEAAKLGLSAQQQEEAAKQAEERFKQQQFATNEQLMQAREKFEQTQFKTNEQLRLEQQREERAVYQAGEAARQQAARLGLSAQEIQERVNQAENQARMSARQQNAALEEQRARLGLASIASDRSDRQQQLDSARLLGQLGVDAQRMEIERLRNLQAAGEIERTMSQRGLDMGYQDFLRQQAFPREQLAFYNAMLQGLPVTPGTTTTTFGGPSETERLLGAGIGGVGLYNATRG